jgi:hypothetical protein
MSKTPPTRFTVTRPGERPVPFLRGCLLSQRGRRRHLSSGRPASRATGRKEQQPAERESARLHPGRAPASADDVSVSIRRDKLWYWLHDQDGRVAEPDIKLDCLDIEIDGPYPSAAKPRRAAAGTSTPEPMAAAAAPRVEQRCMDTYATTTTSKRSSLSPRNARSTARTAAPHRPLDHRYGGTPASPTRSRTPAGSSGGQTNLVRVGRGHSPSPRPILAATRRRR